MSYSTGFDFYVNGSDYPSSKFIPNFNMKDIFQELKKKYPDVPHRDLSMSMINLTFAIEHNKIELLKKIMTNPKVKKDIVEDHYFSFFLQDGLNPEGLSKHQWFSKDHRYYGKDFLSFANHILRCSSNLACVEYIAKLVGISFTDVNVIQQNHLEGYCFIRNVLAYPRDSEVRITFPLSCNQTDNFYFFTGQGNDSFGLEEHRNDEGETLYLYQTRQVHLATGKTVDMHLAPPWRKVLYNLDKINANQEASVQIHDDIRRARDYLSQGVNTWAGEYSYTEKIEWDRLKGRDVAYVFDPKSNASFKIGNKLRSIFKDMGMRLRMFPISNEFPYFPSTNVKYVPVSIEELRTDEEFNALALANHGIDLKPDITAGLFDVMHLDGLHSDSEEKDYVVSRLIAPNEIGIIVGSNKVGKSMTAMDLAIAVAGGESIGGRFFSSRSRTSLYLDGEFPTPEFESRMKKIIEGSYKNYPVIKKNLGYICYRNCPEKLDLSKAENRAKLSKLCKGVDFLVVDNINTFLPPYYTNAERGWNEIFSWLQTISDRGTSIILILHENKSGTQRGTMKIGDGVDIIISLRRPSSEIIETYADGGTLVEFSIERSRYLHGKQLEPCMLRYKEKDDKIVRSVLSIDGKTFECATSFIAAGEKEALGLTELECDILQKARSVFPNSVSASDFIDNETKGRSGSTVTEKFNRLTELGLLTRNGMNKGRTYTAVLKEKDTSED